MKAHVTIAIALAAAACATPSPAPDRLVPSEGRVDVVGGWVWYRIVGSGPRTPLLVVPGIPAASSEYLELLEALADERPVIFFDPLEGGRSANPEHHHLWTLERFVEDLADIRSSLGLARVHLFAHSWSTVLAVEHAAAQPEGIRSLILASPLLDVSRYNDDIRRLVADYPAERREALLRYNRYIDDSGLQLEEGRRFDLLHYCRVNPPPASLYRTHYQLRWWIHHDMLGATTLHLDGMLAGYDGVERLRNLAMPTLITCGRHDTVRPETAKAYSALMPAARLVVFEHSSHLQMLEETERYIEVLRSFLREVDGG